MQLGYVFNLKRETIANFIKITDGLSLEQLNTIPAGYNNNIAWNFAHLIAATQSLCYRLSSLATTVDPTFVAAYGKGTKPEATLTTAEWDNIIQLANSALQKLEEDYKNGIFNTYNSYTTSFGNTLNSIEDAVSFSALHDGLHYGYALALKKLV